MASKRSRVVRSSSQGEIGLFNQVLPIDSPADFFDRKLPTPISTVSKPAKDSKLPALVKKNQPRRTLVFTVGSPERGKKDACSKNKNPAEGFGEFLKACFLCKKKVGEEKDLYMYGYLGAFCSPECRDDQIALDGFNEEISKETTKMRTEGNPWTKNARRLGFRH